MIVDVPYSKEIAYTLFAQGFLMEIPNVDSNGDFVHFKFPPEKVTCLFYTFDSFRRAYIVFEPKNKNQNNQTLPGVNGNLEIIFIAKGRKIDDLKRCLFNLTKDDKYEIFSFPKIFWYKLAGLIQFSKAYKTDVEYLYSQFHKKRRKKSK